MDELKKKIGDQEYWHYSLLSNWEVNKDARLLYNPDWQRLLNSLKKYGVKEQFEIGPDGVTYDGNHRLEGVQHYIRQGILTADNGRSLEWIPVHINDPKDDIEKLAIVARGNGETYAIWRKDFIADNKDVFLQIPDYKDLAVLYEEPVTFEEFGSGFEEAHEEAQTPQKEQKLITCPHCNKQFNPKEK